MKRFLFLSCVALAAIIAIYFFSKTRVHPATGKEKTAADKPTTSRPSQLSETTSVASSNQQPSQISSIHPTTNPDSVQDYLQKKAADPLYDGKQPINFYGRVVDENNVPVANANVRFVWTDLSESGTSETDEKSDNNGFFSLLNKTGKGLSVEVSKDDYYAPHAAFGSFEYANPSKGLFKPDQGNPIVFHLRKKGEGAELTHKYVQVPLNKNGTPIIFNFITGNVSSDGQLQVQTWMPDLEGTRHGKFDWQVVLTVPNGGLQEQNDEFPFLAPDTNYTNSVSYIMSTNDLPNWSYSVEKRFYISFDQPPRYGRLRFYTRGNSSVFTMEYWINPTGSRNLESK